jgi:hypothetical protein
MSSTSLASAIRRRTKTEIVAKTTQGGIPVPPKKNLQSNNLNNSNSSSNNTSSFTDIQATSPLMLLLQHKQLINELQNDVMELKESKNKNMNNPSEIEYYKKQYERLLDEFSEIKKILVKTQAFSMETNLEMLNLKRLLEKNNIEVPPSKMNDESIQNFLNDDEK